MIRTILAMTVLMGGAALAQATHPAPAMPPAPAGQPPSSAAYRAVTTTMMTKMDAPLTGDADRDFVTGMLPHHQGAIDMARVELQYGHDPALRKLARTIIASQSKEEVFMRGWLAKHPAH